TMCCLYMQDARAIFRGGLARAAGGAIRLGTVGERRRHGRAMATERPGPAGGDGGAGPQEAAHRAGGGARLGRTLYAVLWQAPAELPRLLPEQDRKSTRLNSSHVKISYAVFCLKKKNNNMI